MCNIGHVLDLDWAISHFLYNLNKLYYRYRVSLVMEFHYVALDCIVYVLYITVFTYSLVVVILCYNAISSSMVHFSYLSLLLQKQKQSIPLNKCRKFYPICCYEDSEFFWFCGHEDVFSPQTHANHVTAVCGMCCVWICLSLLLVGEASRHAGAWTPGGAESARWR